jgi:hypothetical protein
VIAERSPEVGFDRIVADNIIEAATPNSFSGYGIVLPYAVSRPTNVLQSG